MHIAALVAAAVLGGWTQLGRGPDGGTVWSGHITNTFVADTRPSAIYLPPGYDATRRYPVLYLLHGLRGSPAEYWDSLHLADRVDELVASGAPPFIVVTPVGGQIVHPNAGEWAGPWERYIVDDVVPWVDGHLATIRAPRARMLEGLCAGGFGAVDIGLRHPAIFGALGSWEGYFTPFRDGPFTHATRVDLDEHDPTLLVRREAPLLRRDGTTFYLSAGGNHAQVRGRWTVSFAHELTTLRLRHVLWLAPRNERRRFWSATILSALRFAAHEFE